MRSNEVKNLALKWKEEGKSYNEIGQLLGISRGSAQNLCRYTKKTRCNKRGPKPKLNKYEQLCIKREISKCLNFNEKIFAPKLKKRCSLNVSQWTIQRHLRNLGYKYKNIRQKIFLTRAHKLKRVNIVHEWLSENIDFKKVIFSDEKVFRLDGCDNFMTYVPQQSRLGEMIQRKKRVCGGGSVMIWMMVLPNGLISYKIINGKFNSTKYKTIISETIIPIARLNFGNGFLFQQDNAKVHTAKIIKQQFQDASFSLLKWPAFSPDLNICEDVWKMLSNQIYDGPQFENVPNLKKAISSVIKEFNANETEKVKHLYDSIGSRLSQVLLRRGEIFNK